MQFLVPLWCWKLNQAIKRSKITQVFGFGIEIRREGKRLITLKSEVWKLGKKGKNNPRTRITSKNALSKASYWITSGLAPLRNKQEIIICESEDLYKEQPHMKALKTVGGKAMECVNPEAFVMSSV